MPIVKWGETIQNKLSEGDHSEEGCVLGEIENHQKNILYLDLIVLGSAFR